MRLILLLAILCLLVACAETTDYQEPVTEEVEEAAEEVVEEPEETVEAEPVVQDENLKAELEALLNSDPEFVAEYMVESNVDGQSTSGVQIVAVSGDNSKQETEFDSMFVMGEDVLVCDHEEELCYIVPQEEPPETIDIELPDDLQISRLDDAEYAGEASKCYEISSADDVVHHCFTPEGITLYFNRQAEGYEVLMFATDVSREVPESEFILPYQAVQFDPEEFS